MSTIIICGHRNPDMDSVCAAYAYAELKNTIDPSNTYVAVRCGHLTDSVRGQFNDLGITPPPHRKDIYPRVSDVVRTPDRSIQKGDPVSHLIQLYNDHPSVLPVFDGEQFCGLLSVDDTTAWFLRENAEKRPRYSFDIDNFARSVDGKIIHRGKQTRFEAELIAGAMDFETFKARIDAMDRPVLVVGHQDRHIMYGVGMGLPAIVITGTGGSDLDFSGYDGTVFCTETDTAETLRLLRMSCPVGNIMGKQGAPLQMNDLFDEGKERLASSNLRGLSVYDGDKWAGFVTRRCFLERPMHKVIMVDHNELEQGIPGLETAKVVEIIDHHRLDPEKTSSPIFFDAEPLGSTCTIVYRLFQRHRVVPERDTARVLLSGLLADTVLLKSPTTTDEDRTVAGELADLGGIENLGEFGLRMYSHSRSLRNMDLRKATEEDFKRYNEHGIHFGIGQCEVPHLSEITAIEQRLVEVLEEVRKAYNLDWTMLMITDVYTASSVLAVTDFKLNGKLSYRRLSKNLFSMPGVLSRKRQLLPEVIRVIVE